MNLPKVKFINIPLSKEIHLMCGFLFRNEMGWWGKYIIEKHPSIKKVFSFKTKSEQIKFLKDYIVGFRKQNKKLIEKNKMKYQTAWQKIEKDFFATLLEIIQVDWFKKTIKAMISINPISPRFLNDWSFSIFYNYQKISQAMEIIMHECCHFFYFEKWKKIYPKISCEKFRPPHIEWHLSEIIAPIILNDHRIQKLLKQKAIFYIKHGEIKIGNKTAPRYFNDLYKKTIKENNFEEFLKKSYQVIKKNRVLFKRVLSIQNIKK